MELWYAIQLLPNQQKTAEFNLKRQNFISFFPTLIDRRAKKVEPLFKGYGFVYLDLDTQHWTPINSTRGVVHLVPRNRDRPIPFKQGFVELLIENDPITINDFVDLLEDIKPGSTVEVSEGLYRGDKATVVSIKNRLIELVFRPPERRDNEGFFMGQGRLYIERSKVRIASGN